MAVTYLQNWAQMYDVRLGLRGQDAVLQWSPRGRRGDDPRSERNKLKINVALSACFTEKLSSKVS